MTSTLAGGFFIGIDNEVNAWPASPLLEEVRQVWFQTSLPFSPSTQVWLCVIEVTLVYVVSEWVYMYNKCW